MSPRVFILAGLVGLMVCLAGCGPSKAERERRERARLEEEEQAQRDMDVANKAITEMNQKLGRKPPALNLGVPADPTTKPADSTPDQPKQP